MKTKFITLLMVIVTIMSCGKDDDVENNDVQNNIVGRWTVTAVEEISYFNDVEYTRSNELDGEYIFEFRQDGTGQDNTEGDINQFTYIATEQTLSIKYPNEDPEVFQIEKHTNTELELHLDETKVFNGESTREVVNITLSKN
jgi:hypothetical protein